MYNSALITKSQALMLIDSPDTNKLLGSEAKRIQAVELEIERSIKTGKLTDPLVVRVLGLELFLDKARKMFAHIVVEEGSDSDKLLTLQNLIAELQARLETQMQMDQVQAQADGQEGGQNKPQPLQT